jgi:UDP-3-O-acyl N-acetylglucosamine deacetylase
VTGKILIVDDDRKVRDSIRDVLVDEGFRVATAADGAEALAAVEAEAPRLVLLDVWMPELDGIEVLRRIHDAGAHPPVIVLSGHGNVEMAVKATKLGAVDFIEKPFSIDGLLSSVRRALDNAAHDAGARDESSARDAAAHDAAVDAHAASGVVPAHAAASARGARKPQRTLRRSVVGGGHGLHSGVRTGLILHPLPPGSGIRFGRVGSEEYIEALVENVDSTGYATSLYKHGLVARTVEHLMASLHAYGITNLLIKVDSEVPILDGSAAEFCRLIESVGVQQQEAAVPVYELREKMRFDGGDGGFIELEPYAGLSLTYELSYPEPVGEQTYTFELDGADAFRREIAPARTFGFVEEIRALESAGLGQGGQLGNFILIGETGIVNTRLRFPEELARHKILDLLGDLYLLGMPLHAKVRARKTGHRHNVALVRELRARAAAH